jgi:hypothetical protein
MRTFVLALCAGSLLWNAAAIAQNASVAGATITWYGNFKPGKIETVPDAGTSPGKKDIVTKLTPPSTNSDRIIAVAPSQFGFGYVLNGRPATAVIKIRHVRKMPAPGMIDQKTGEAVLTNTTFVNASIDRKDLFIGQAINNPASLPIGQWTLQVWYGDKLLAEKSFTVVKQ